MAQPKFVLKIYCLNQPLLSTEWRSVLGDKYAHALPFNFVITDKIQDADVIAWDGAMTLKQRRLLPEIESYLQKGKVLLMMGEVQTLYKDHPFIQLYQSSQVATIQLTGWSVLPEEILAALELCYQKITNV